RRYNELVVRDARHPVSRVEGSMAASGACSSSSTRVGQRAVAPSGRGRLWVHEPAWAAETVALVTPVEVVELQDLGRGHAGSTKPLVRGECMRVVRCSTFSSAGSSLWG